MARLLLQGKDLETLGDDWSVGEADLCSRLTTGCSLVRLARYTGGRGERELSMAGWAGEASAEVIPKLQFDVASGLHQVTWERGSMGTNSRSNMMHLLGY